MIHILYEHTHYYTEGPAQIRGTEATYGTSVYMCLHPIEHNEYLVTTQKLTNQWFNKANSAFLAKY